MYVPVPRMFLVDVEQVKQEQNMSPAGLSEGELSTLRFLIEA